MNAIPVEIREYREEDYSHLDRLMQGFYREVEYQGEVPSGIDLGEKSKDRLSDIVNNENTHCLVAVSDDEVVGFREFHEYMNNADQYRRPGVVELTRMYVDEDYRGRKIGQKLDAVAIAGIKRMENAEKILAQVEDTNGVNLAIKEKMGFRVENEYYDKVDDRRWLILYLDLID